MEPTESPQSALVPAPPDPDFVALLAALDASERGSRRDALIEKHLPLVEHCAWRFAHRGEPVEDLIQVGTIGLIKAVDRFDPDRGVAFSSYATPTIIGEIKRHFRDRGWAIRVPRRLQEMRMSITRAAEELQQTLGRSPSPGEIAEALGVDLEAVLEGLESAQAYSTLSLEAGESDPDDPGSILDTLGEDAEELEQVELRETLRPHLEALPARERRILLLRYFHQKTQAQIAAEIGISQMHVSRLLARTLADLRNQVG